MPYFDRLIQLTRTLVSFAHHYGARDDYEIIIVEDAKNTDGLREMLVTFMQLPIHILKMRTGQDNYTPAKQYNEGARVAKGTYLVLTNPECFHTNDILDNCDQLFKQPFDNMYVVCACRHVTNCTMNLEDFWSLRYRTGKWFQHSQERNNLLNFCSIMPAQFYQEVGGFDEEFGPGYAFADDDFRDRVKLLASAVIPADSMLVLHQEHTKFHSYVNATKYRARHERNRILYERRRSARAK